MFQKQPEGLRCIEELYKEYFLKDLQNNYIFFVNLKKTSFTELDRLFNLLVEFKDIKIEISGHTDNLGSEVYNELLSQKRNPSTFWPS